MSQTYSTVNGAVEGVQEFASNATARGIVFNQQNLWRADPTGIGELPLLSDFYRLLTTSFRRLWWHRVWDIVDVFAVHWIDTIVLTDRIDEVVEIIKTH